MPEMCLPTKTQLLNGLLALIGEEVTTLGTSLASAKEAATHSESKPENKYDTRGLEASYLAGAQGERLAALQSMIFRLQHLPTRDFSPGDKVGLTAVVELVNGDERCCYWLLPVAGGYTLRGDGYTLQTVTLEAPLAKAILGKELGDSVELRVAGKSREYELVAIS